MNSPTGNVTGEQLERRLRKLDVLDVVMALTHRLALAIDKLGQIARECAECGGTGETEAEYVAYTMTDDPRLLAGGYAHHRVERLRQFGAMVERLPRGRALLRAPCEACADIRKTIKICEASE